MKYLAEIIERVINIGINIQQQNNSKTIKEFTQYFEQSTELVSIRLEIINWMSTFPFYE
jgi:hypothetical protein